MVWKDDNLRQTLRQSKMNFVSTILICEARTTLCNNNDNNNDNKNNNNNNNNNNNKNGN